MNACVPVPYDGEIMVGNYLLYSLTLGYFLFTFIYGVFFRWYTNEVGLIFFPAKVLMCLVLFQTSVSVWTRSDYPARGEIRYTLYGGGTLAIFSMVALLVYLIIRKKRNLKAKREGRPIPCPHADQQEDLR